MEDGAESLQDPENYDVYCEKVFPKKKKSYISKSGAMEVEMDKLTRKGKI